MINRCWCKFAAFADSCRLVKHNNISTKTSIHPPLGYFCSSFRWRYLESNPRCLQQRPGRRRLAGRGSMLAAPASRLSVYSLHNRSAAGAWPWKAAASSTLPYRQHGLHTRAQGQQANSRKGQWGSQTPMGGSRPPWGGGRGYLGPGPPLGPGVV